VGHTVIPPLRCTVATLELTHKGNVNDKTITERDREVGDFNITLRASTVTRGRHFVIDTNRTFCFSTQVAHMEALGRSTGETRR